MKESLRFILNFVFIVLLFLILFSYAMFQGGFTSWFLFYSFLPIFLYHLGLLLHSIQKWEVSRNLSKHVVRAGDSITVTVRIQRSFPFPLYYCICEEIYPDSLKRIDNRKDKYLYMNQPNKLNVDRKIKKIVFPSIRKVFEFSYRMEQIPRGEHQMQALRISTGDVFGFVKKEHIFKLPDQIVAYPNERPIHMAEQMSSFEQGSTSSYSLNLKNTNIATGIREYMPGDKFSWIDWKQTARKNEVMTKEFEQEKSTDILLILDSCNYKGSNPLEFEAAVEVTVSLMEAIRKQSTQVGLLSIGENVTQFPMHHDPRQQDFIRKHLTQIQLSGNQSFAVKLKEEMLKIGSGNIVMIITTHMDDVFRKSIQQVNGRTKRVMVIFIKSAKSISKTEHAVIQQLQFEGIGIHVLTEEQLAKNPIEVNMT
ncbi:DUF58 domain-containing protein [Virgibacillus profundi]|uniref:DUF58 domain-containing protein n=1 Tax=Virgibacillus profundi TaxID=2024555 RepID=A0A2A2I918_9BACI|nr:DUF58 domain-containing protein [Virgibacillus profundi]PAV27816.1 DUF58 domain-containing protein [Virgibacillus profundi]PXY51943.1 DUF58 domain-containing protein [Virgibacillus profundi]